MLLGHGGQKGQRKHPLDIVWKNLAKEKREDARSDIENESQTGVFRSLRPVIEPTRKIHRVCSLSEQFGELREKSIWVECGNQNADEHDRFKNGFLFALKPEKIKSISDKTCRMEKACNCGEQKKLRVVMTSQFCDGIKENRHTENLFKLIHAD